MTITVTLTINQPETITRTIDLEELNLSIHEWADMSNENRRTALQNAIDETEQPCWIVEKF